MSDKEAVKKSTTKRDAPSTKFDGSRPGPGRPKGVPNKATREIKELIQARAPELIEEAIRLALKARSEMVRKAAIEMLLDRGYGRPKQEIDMTSNGETMTSGVLVVPGVMSEADWEASAQG